MPTQDQIVAELQRLNLYKPPPPYPGIYRVLLIISYNITLLLNNYPFKIW